MIRFTPPVYALHRFISYLPLFLLCWYGAAAQTDFNQHNITWTTQSKNAGESMPCGGGDVGLNVWVENGEILFYIARSGTFDENNSLLKAGRVRIKFSPNPFAGNQFKQQLHLKDGTISITGAHKNIQATVNIWVDVFSPSVHADISCTKKISVEAIYENWRYRDRPLKGRAAFGSSYKWAPPADTKTLKDSIGFEGSKVLFYHRNATNTVFDVTVKQQGLDSIKDQLYNPLDNLTFGGIMEGTNMQASGTTGGTCIDTDFKGWKLKSKSPAKQTAISLYLYNGKTATLRQWKDSLMAQANKARGQRKTTRDNTRLWWNAFWQRSYIQINPFSRNKPNDEAWQAGRNYQLMRYMLACNAYGDYPTKFNGGLFTYDPYLVDTSNHSTPDFRNWGGGTFTAQNQRLVYFPLLKSGDADVMKPAFDFYLRLLKNAEMRSRFYWQHEGASFTEQLENFGLPNPAEYGWKRPADYDKGMEYNAWLEYEWDTVLEFCWMMLETERYAGNNIQPYLPFIESCLTFFKEHYEYLARQRGSKVYDGNGHLVLYPGSAAETYKMAYNSTTTIAALKTILTRLVTLPENQISLLHRTKWQQMLKLIPPVSFASFNGHVTIAPAQHWQRVNNTESPQLYPVYPWGIYGVGKPGLDTAINTYLYDTNAVKFRSHVGWKQDNIFAARLGLTDEAARLNSLKMKDSERRFPAFWGPGFDWTPDHNWGGSGMIGLQEMLLQTDDRRIMLFAAWPRAWDVHFKLHAPYKTTIEGILRNGKLESLKVFPEERRADVEVML